MNLRPYGIQEHFWIPSDGLDEISREEEGKKEDDTDTSNLRQLESRNRGVRLRQPTPQLKNDNMGSKDK